MTTIFSFYHRQRGIQLACHALTLALAVGFLSMSSRIALPFFVPFTLQTLAVSVVGILLSPRHAFITTLAWLSLGASGAPVFTLGSFGPGVLFSVTGGYLWAMLAAAPLTSYLYRVFLYGGGQAARQHALMPLDQTPSGVFWKGFVASMAGQGLVLILGGAWLAFVVGDSQQALWLGVLPFVGPEILKAALVGFLFKRTRAKK